MAYIQNTVRKNARKTAARHDFESLLVPYLPRDERCAYHHHFLSTLKAETRYIFPGVLSLGMFQAMPHNVLHGHNKHP